MIAAGSVNTVLAHPECDCTAPPMFGDYSFTTSVLVGYDPNLVVADFNGDTFPDMAWLSEPIDDAGEIDPYIGSKVSIALGHECGRFTETGVFDTGVCSELVTGDFDHDGDIDLATNSGGLSILLGAGDGTFGPPTPVFTGPIAYSLGSHDLDGDGDSDLVSGLGVFRNDWPDFTPTDSVEPGDSTSKAPFEFADVNGNGRTEIIYSGDVIELDDDLNITKLNGIIGSTMNLQVADFDNDGQPELATSTSGSGDRLRFWEFTSTQSRPITLSPVDWGTGSSYGSYDAGLRAFDADQDGHIDIVSSSTFFRPTNPTSRQSENGERIYREYGNRQVGPLVEYADVNRDGTPDRLAPGRVALARPDADLLPRWDTIDIPVEPSYRSVNATHLLATDLDGDGREDLFFHTRERTYSAFTTDAGSDVLPYIGPLTPDEGGQAGVAFIHHPSDLDGDGWTDIVAGCFDGTIWVYHNNGDKTLTPTVLSPAPGQHRGLVVLNLADLDGDGDDDVVAAWNDHADTSIPDNVPTSELVVYRNDAGVLTPTQTVALAVEGNWLSLLLTDRDADGDLDVILTDQAENAIPGLQILDQNEAGDFLPAGRVDLGLPSYWIIEADYDNDGTTEVLVSLEASNSPSGASIVAFDREPGGQLLLGSPSQILQVDRDRVNEFIVRDLDHDGASDIALVTGQNTSNPRNHLKVYRGHPGGAFSYDSEARYRRTQGGGLATLAVLDLNQDGYDDLVYGGLYIEAELQRAVTYGPCRSDTNGDGVVDFAEIQAFIASFLEQLPAADLNRDTVVDLADIGEFVTRFVEGC